MLFSISVMKEGSRGPQSRQMHHSLSHSVQNTESQVSSLCGHCTWLIYDSAAHQVLGHREGNALASTSVSENMPLAHMSTRLAVWVTKQPLFG